MLDDNNVLRQRDPDDALGAAAAQFEQARFSVRVAEPDHDGREITRVVVAGMGSSTLAARLVRAWLKSELAAPLEVICSFSLPKYVDHNTLVIVSSYSGNTEEVLSVLADAQTRTAQVAVMTAGGRLQAIARKEEIANVELPTDLHPRMATICQLRALVALLAHFGVISFDHFTEIADQADWLGEETLKWVSGVTTDKNYAKQLALLSVGKTPVFYGGDLTASVAHGWRVAWNTNAKNIAFCDKYPDFDHSGLVGWTSHPIEKPFAVFDLVSKFEDPRILRRFEVSDRLLSGRRPKAMTIELRGDSVVAQLLWGMILADFTSIYVAILNGVDPTPVPIVEKLKKELAA